MDYGIKYYGDPQTRTYSAEDHCAHLSDALARILLDLAEVCQALAWPSELRLTGANLDSPCTPRLVRCRNRNCHGQAKLCRLDTIRRNQPTLFTTRGRNLHLASRLAINMSLCLGRILRRGHDSKGRFDVAARGQITSIVQFPFLESVPISQA